MTTALTTRVAGLVSSDQWTIMRDQAAILVKSGLLPSAVNSPEKAVAIMLKGSELGIPPMYALSNIVVIQGKPTANAELMLALIYRDHGDNAVIFEDSTAERCVISYSRRAWPARKQFAFTMDDARKANLLSNATWQKYPAAMLRARAISAVARMAFPDSIGGMYTPEELGAVVQVNSETGEIIVDAQDVTPVPNGHAETTQDARPHTQATPNTNRATNGPSVPAGAGNESAAAFKRAAETAGLSDDDQKALIRQTYPGRGFSTLTPDEWRALERHCRAMYSDVPVEEPIF